MDALAQIGGADEKNPTWFGSGLEFQPARIHSIGNERSAILWDAPVCDEIFADSLGRTEAKVDFAGIGIVGSMFATKRGEVRQVGFPLWKSRLLGHENSFGRKQDVNFRDDEEAAFSGFAE